MFIKHEFIKNGQPSLGARFGFTEMFYKFSVENNMDICSNTCLGSSS